MVVVNIRSMPPKAIGRKARGPFSLSKDPRPKRCPNIWNNEEAKEAKDFMKVEDGGVHYNKYNGYCMKQWIKIPKVTWTSPILGRRSTCWTSFNKTSFMKDDVKDEVPNETSKTLIPFNGVLNKDGVSKLGNRLKGNHV